MKIIELKLKTQFWYFVKSGVKNWEVRKNDRDFRVGDILKLKAFKDGEYATWQDDDYEGAFTPAGWYYCPQAAADTITARVTAVCDSETWERSTATHDCTGYPVGVDYREVRKILASYFHTDRVPEGYVVLRIEVQNET